MAMTDDILKALKQAGYKFTGKRKAIVDLFVEHASQHFSVRDVYDFVSQQHRNISLDTVYRTIALLEEHEVIEQVQVNDGVSKYQLACEHTHHHHLICIGCGQTTVLKDCPMPLLDMNYGDFRPLRHRFDIYGYCGACDKAHSSDLSS